MGKEKREERESLLVNFFESQGLRLAHISIESRAMASSKTMPLTCSFSQLRIKKIPSSLRALARSVRGSPRQRCPASVPFGSLAYAQQRVTENGPQRWFGHKTFRATASDHVTTSASDGNFADVKPSVAFFFPGQGAQSVGMCAAVCEEVPAAKDLFDKASEILGYDLLDVCVNGPAEKLNSTVVSQPAIFVASMAAVERLRAQEGGQEIIDSANVAAGLSLGEYTALCFAGAISFEDGLRVVKARGEAMQAAADSRPTAMCSVIGLKADKVEELCKAATEEAGEGESVQIANFLCNGNYAVSGTVKAIEVLEAKAKPEINVPRIPVYSNVDAKAHSDPEVIKSILAMQVTSPVQWETTLGGLLEGGLESSYELGPGKVIAGIMKRVDRKHGVNSITV